jgi:hypothetical protein
MAFLAYHVSEYNHDKNLPIAAARGRIAMERTCESCVFWGRLDGHAQYTDHKATKALCCRFPARVEREKNDWCGEHKGTDNEDTAAKTSFCFRA